MTVYEFGWTGKIRVKPECAAEAQKILDNLPDPTCPKCGEGMHLMNFDGDVYVICMNEDSEPELHNRYICNYCFTNGESQYYHIDRTPIKDVV